MTADSFLIEWLIGVESQWCVSFPLKPTPLSRATGQEGGRQADWQLALAPVPSSNKPDTKKAAGDNTNSTMIGSDGSQSAAKSGGVIIDCFFFFLSASADRREEGVGDWSEMSREKFTDRRRCFNKPTLKKIN